MTEKTKKKKKKKKKNPTECCEIEPYPSKDRVTCNHEGDNPLF
jgi:hypothetical protein